MAAATATNQASRPPETPTRPGFAWNANANSAAGSDPWIQTSRFYHRIGRFPVWVGPHGLLPQGKTLLRVIAGASDAGLIAADYSLPYPEQIHARTRYYSTAMPPMENDPRRQFDLNLTRMLLRYARDLSQGRIAPAPLSRDWPVQGLAAAHDIPIEIAEALIENRLKEYIESLHPQGRAYRQLRIALHRYEAIEEAGGWPQIPSGETLRRGDTGPRVVTLMRRLLLTGDLTGMAPFTDSIFDSQLEAAVFRFQRRHGLRADGVVGGRTLAELNVPVEKRITQLQLNMERWRWFPDSLGQRYLMVNIPAFELNIVEQRQSVIRMRAIVGRKRRQTPVMASRITYLAFNPYWNIPRKIACKDILPKVIEDPSYLARKGIRIFDGWDRQARELDPAKLPWESLAACRFPYRMRQDPSDMNALGRIKFMFPNPYSVYIHDTPGKALFHQRERSFSSGCVRAESPLALAAYLLRDQGWNQKRLEAVVSSGQPRTVILATPIPVYLVYFTTWVDDKGEVNFRQDIYDRDRRLLATLEARTPEPVVYAADRRSSRPAKWQATQ
jgi:L,D-transpeptidase YcbB